MPEKAFKLRENGTDIKTEILAGITTFNLRPAGHALEMRDGFRCGYDGNLPFERARYFPF